MSTFGPKLSKAGSIASLVCAVHCAVTPLALLALPGHCGPFLGWLRWNIRGFLGRHD